MALKEQRILYAAKNWQNGLTTVKAFKVRRNGVEVAQDLSLTQVSATGSEGLYELVVSPAQLTSWGGAGVYDFYINSTESSKSAPAIAVRYVTVNDEDDNATAISSINTIVSDIQSKVNNGTYGLSALQGLLNVLQTTINTTTTDLADIKGAGFISTDDSLKAISDRIYSGGTAI